MLVEHHGVNSLFTQKKGISVERIPFDTAHWETLKLKLNTYMYYFNHFIKTAATKFGSANLPLLLLLSLVPVL